VRVGDGVLVKYGLVGEDGELTFLHVPKEVLEMTVEGGVNE